MSCSGMPSLTGANVPGSSSVSVGAPSVSTGSPVAERSGVPGAIVYVDGAGPVTLRCMTGTLGMNEKNVPRPTRW